MVKIVKNWLATASRVMVYLPEAQNRPYTCIMCTPFAPVYSGGGRCSQRRKNYRSMPVRFCEISTWPVPLAR